MSDEQGIRAVADALYTMAERVMDAPTTLEIVPTAPAELPAAIATTLSVISMVPSIFFAAFGAKYGRINNNCGGPRRAAPLRKY